MHNHSNYQSVCLAQNLDDIAQDIMQTKVHFNGIHADLETIEHNQSLFREQFGKIMEKLETI